jgi:hypothetical protein
LLELYFEHRNYLPLYGPCLALSLLAWTSDGTWRRIGPALLLSYIGLNTAILLAVTVRWGQPFAAAESWAETHPGSARAALHMVHVQFGLANASSNQIDEILSPQQKREISLAVLDRTQAICPECLDISLQALIMACEIEPPESVAERLRKTIALAPQGNINRSVVDAFFVLEERISGGHCQHIRYADVYRIQQSLAGHPQYEKSELYTKLEFAAAMIAEKAGNVSAVETHLNSAERASPAALPVLQYQVHFYQAQGRKHDALAAIERREALFARHGLPTEAREALAQLRAELASPSN